MAALIPIAMGVGNGIIPNDAIRASTVYDRYHVPSQARLNNAKKGKYAGAWRPKINDKKQYLEVDLGAVSRVTQVCLMRSFSFLSLYGLFQSSNFLPRCCIVELTFY